MFVRQLDNKNQFIINHDGALYFQSYESLIAKYERGVLTLYPHWCYSRTTLKHLYIFIFRYTYLDLTGVKNKKEYIQKLIDDGKIIKGNY